MWSTWNRWRHAGSCHTMSLARTSSRHSTHSMQLPRGCYSCAEVENPVPYLAVAPMQTSVVELRSRHPLGRTRTSAGDSDRGSQHDEEQQRDVRNLGIFIISLIQKNNISGFVTVYICMCISLTNAIACRDDIQINTVPPISTTSLAQKSES